MHRKTLLIVGCGDIGSGLAEWAQQQDWRVLGLRRNVEQLPPGVEPLQADLRCAEAMAQLGRIRADYVVMTLVPQSQRPEGYEAVFEQGLDHILSALYPPRQLIFVSSTGVYHQHDHEWVDEDSATEPGRFSGQSLLAAEEKIRDSGWPFTIVRFAGIYGPGRVQMVNKVLAGECSPPEPLHYTNRIHRDDCVGFLIHLLELADAGLALLPCYLAADDQPAPIQEVQSWLAEQLAVPYRTDGEAVSRTGSKRCRNLRLRNSGYSLIHPDYRSGFAKLVEKLRA